MNTPHSTEFLDHLLNLMRSYFEAERHLNEQVVLCETEADLIARQREQLLADAREALRTRLDAHGFRSSIAQ